MCVLKVQDAYEVLHDGFPIPDIDLRLGGAVQPAHSGASDPVVKYLKYHDRIQQTELRSDMVVYDLMDGFLDAVFRRFEWASAAASCVPA